MGKRTPIEPFTHPRPPRAVVFDLDGTLVDSVPVIAAAFNAGLKATGHRPMRVADIAAMLGPPLERLYASRVQSDEVAPACAAYREEFARLYREHLQPMAGAHELLDTLRERGISTAVCTNRRHHVQEILDLTGLSGRVQAVVTLQDAPEHPKPDPEQLYIAMERLDAIPAEACYVGDSRADMTAARAANMWVIGLCTLGLAAHELEAAGAHVVARDLNALPKVLGLVEPEPQPEAAPAAPQPEPAVAAPGDAEIDEAEAAAPDAAPVEESEVPAGKAPLEQREANMVWEGDPQAAGTSPVELAPPPEAAAPTEAAPAPEAGSPPPATESNESPRAASEPTPIPPQAEPETPPAASDEEHAPRTGSDNPPGY